MKNFKVPVKEIGLTVSARPSHVFRGYGMYVGRMGKTDEKIRKNLEKKIFEELNVKVVHQCFEMCHNSWTSEAQKFKDGEDHFNPYNEDELDAWIEKEMELVGYGWEFTEDMKKHGAVYAMNLCNVEKHHLGSRTVGQIYEGASEEIISLVRGNGPSSALTTDGVHPIDDDYIPLLTDKAVLLTERMIKKYGIPIKYISVCDEPNGGQVTPDQMCVVIKETRRKLDEKGLTDVKINGPATAGLNLAYSKAVRGFDADAFDIYDKITVHSFGTGVLTKEIAADAFDFGKELWISSTGAPGDIKFSELPRNENGEIVDTEDVYGVANASAVLVDVNLGASYMGCWAAVNDTRVFNQDLKMQYAMLVADKTESRDILGKDILVTRAFEYIHTILTAVGENSSIYYCESSEEGSMTERTDITNALKNQMAALAGLNSDGKMGIVIMNKTDSETRFKELDRLYENFKVHNLAGHSVKLDVELDVELYHGTGEKKFTVVKTGKNGMYLQKGEDITLKDGKAVVRVEPFEIIALREI